MSKKIILSASILAVGVIIAGGIVLVNTETAEAAPIGGGILQACQKDCVTVYIGAFPYGSWETFCQTTCPSGA